MKKWIGLTLVLAMSCTLFAACGSADGQSEESNASQETSVQESGDAAGTTATTTFTVGFDAEFPPYGYQDENGEYVGFDLDLAQEVCDRNGWTLVKQPIEWDSKDLELSSGAIDCIWNGFTINGREDDYTWTDAYIDNTQVFVVRTADGVSDIASLAGLNVLVQSDSSALAALSDMPEVTDTFASLTEVADYNTAFMMLESGSADAIALDVAVAKYQLESRGDDTYMILDEVLSSEQYGVGFKLGNTELRDQVQATLYEMLEDGTLQTIAEEWGVADMLCLGQ